MKRQLAIFAIFVVTASSVVAQSLSVARVMADESMREFIWAVGYGASIQEADRDALCALSSRDVNIVNVGKSSMDDRVMTSSVQSEEVNKQEMLSVSSMYLENVRREILPDMGEQKRVLRYITREDWEARHDALRNKILEYIENGRYAPMVEDKVRYFVWAYVLLQSLPDDGNQLKVDATPARQWLLTQVRTMLGDIEVSVIGIEQDKQNRNYPYKLFLDVTHKGEPVSYLCFRYFDGSGFVEGESVKDGRSTIQMKSLPEQFALEIDCLSADLARQVEPSVYVLLQNPRYATSFEAGQKRVVTKPQGVKPKKEVNTLAEQVASPVKNALAEIEATYVAPKEQVADTQPYDKVMADIVGAISGVTKEDVSRHFTPVAWEHYRRIVGSGSPMVARTPCYRYIHHDSLVICRGLTLKLRFPGNNSFIEDVVFRVNEKSGKVESVAYALSARTEQTIMAMNWEDRARLTLLSFLEDYRTAYCLKDLEYINKVFADDAYIIVGRVLKQSTKRFNDRPYEIGGERTIYSRKSKQQYIYDLRKSFASKEFVNIRFEECNVAKGFYDKEGIYAVQVQQLYFSDNYADDGVLTLAVDMRNDSDPLVRVRVWQQQRDVTYTAEQMIERTVSTNNSLN